MLVDLCCPSSKLASTAGELGCGVWVGGTTSPNKKGEEQRLNHLHLLQFRSPCSAEVGQRTALLQSCHPLPQTSKSSIHHRGGGGMLCLHKIKPQRRCRVVAIVDERFAVEHGIRMPRG